MHDLWRELSAAMRLLRTSNDRSLRWVEAESGCGRGALSQIENCKTRAPLRLVEWYDEAFAGDGVLTSIYAAAVLGGERKPPSRTGEFKCLPGDSAEIGWSSHPAGALVGVDEQHTLSWVLRNVGTIPWRNRALRRVGAVAAPGLIRSRRGEPIPDCEPGDETEVSVVVTTPKQAGTVVAYWEIVDDTDAVRFDRTLLSALLVVL